MCCCCFHKISCQSLTWNLKQKQHTVEVLPIVALLTYESSDVPSHPRWDWSGRWFQSWIALYWSLWNAVFCSVQQPPISSPQFKGLINVKKIEFGFNFNCGQPNVTEVALLSKLIWPGQLNRCCCYIVDMLCKHWKDRVNREFKHDFTADGKRQRLITFEFVFDSF